MSDTAIVSEQSGETRSRGSGAEMSDTAIVSEQSGETRSRGSGAGFGEGIA